MDKNAYNAYSSYSAAQTKEKTTQVVMLYDGVISMMQRAREAMDKNDIQTRYELIERCSQIILGLQASLDFEKGGEIAELMKDYYFGIDIRLIKLMGKNDLVLCDQVIKELKTMRGAWEYVDEQYKENKAKGNDAIQSSDATPEGETPHEELTEESQTTMPEIVEEGSSGVLISA